jgi:hypothetical protein
VARLQGRPTQNAPGAGTASQALRPASPRTLLLPLPAPAADAPSHSLPAAPPLLVPALVVARRPRQQALPLGLAGGVIGAARQGGQQALGLSGAQQGDRPAVAQDLQLAALLARRGAEEREAQGLVGGLAIRA